MTKKIGFADFGGTLFYCRHRYPNTRKFRPCPAVFLANCVLDMSYKVPAALWAFAISTYKMECAHLHPVLEYIENYHGKSSTGCRCAHSTFEDAFVDRNHRNRGGRGRFEDAFLARGPRYA